MRISFFGSVLAFKYLLICFLSGRKAVGAHDWWVDQSRISRGCRK